MEFDGEYPGIGVEIMKVFQGFLNQNFYRDFPGVGKDRIKILGWGKSVPEGVMDRRSRSTSPLLIVLMIHPD